MRPLPPGLPGPHSSTWHSRRRWDPVGYLRVRSLANPRWRRDVPWLLSALRRSRPPAADPLRALFDQALAAATRYPHTEGGARDAEQSWDELLVRLDSFLVANQRRHIDEVRDAGCSGDQVPGPGE